MRMQMNLNNIISLLGGVALFLFGMTLMGDGLKKVAGSKLELVLYRLSGTPLRGVLLGTGVTAVIQSSSATSVMVVGFVNSGMMKLRQAIAVILGALLGTSVTGWIICLSELEGSGWVALFSTSTLSAVIAVCGIILRMFSRSQQRCHVGDIMLGFSVLMFGMQSMSAAVSPLRESAAFVRLITSFSNPLLGILAGALHSAERERCGRHPSGTVRHGRGQLCGCVSGHPRHRDRRGYAGAAVGAGCENRRQAHRLCIS